MEDKGHIVDNLTSNFKVVDINTVVPNDWNPKKDNPERYQEVLDSIKTYGLRSAILTREHDGSNQIIDGYHRHKACKELGYTKVIVNDQGVVDDATAKKLTIVFQKVQVPFDEVMYGELLRELTGELGEEDILGSLPIKEPELEGYNKMAEFNFEEAYKDMNLNEGETKNMRGITIVFNEDQADIVRKAIDAVRQQADDSEMSPARAVELMSADYLAGAIPDDKEE